MVLSGVGYRWPASISKHVGEILSWCQCDCVRTSHLVNIQSPKSGFLTFVVFFTPC